MRMAVRKAMPLASRYRSTISGKFLLYGTSAYDYYIGGSQLQAQFGELR